MRFKLLASVLAGLACVMLAPTAGASPLIIDTFNAPAGGHLAVGGDPFPTTFGPDLGIGALGATRTINFTGTSSAGSVLGLGDTFALNTISNPGQFSMFTGTSSVQAELSYVFPAQSLEGYSGIELEFNFYNEGSPPGSDVLRIELTTASGTLTATLSPVPPMPLGVTVVFFPFSSFSGSGTLASVTGITIFLNDPNPGTDFVLNEVRLPIVPEPGTVALFGLGLLGIVGVTLRRRFPTRLSASRS